MKKFGFTLGEILIALAIVGVVAALTIPQAVTSYQDKLLKTKLNHTVVDVQNAISNYMNDEQVKYIRGTKIMFPMNSECNETTKNCTQGVAYFINNYFDINKKIDCSTRTNCLGVSYKFKDGDNYGDVEADYCAMTKKGVTICGKYGERNLFVDLVVDLNGSAPPNVYNKDLHPFDLGPSGGLQFVHDTDI